MGLPLLEGEDDEANLGTSGAQRGHVGFESQCDRPAGLPKWWLEMSLELGGVGGEDRLGV